MLVVRFTRSIVATEALAFVSGGEGEEEPAPVESPVETPAYDQSANEPSQNFDVGAPAPEYPTEAPQIDPGGATPQYDDAALAQNRSDMFDGGGYQNPASPTPSYENQTPTDPTGGTPTDPTGGTPTGGTPTDPTGGTPTDPGAAAPTSNDSPITSDQFGPLPEPITEPPRIELPSDAQVAAGPTPQEIFNARVDIAQNYEDLASPSQLQQGGRNDCFNVAALNVLNNENPEYINQLAQQTNNPNNVWNVHTLDRRGSEAQTFVQGDPIRNGATTQDPSLQAVYNGTSLLYHPGRPGGSAGDAMERVGASVYNTTPEDAVRAVQNREGGAVLGTYSGPQVARDPALQQEYRDRNLHDWHAYQVASVIRNDADGRDYAVLRNPWGSGNPDRPGNVHPAPIPVDELGRYFSGGSVGTTRPR